MKRFRRSRESTRRMPRDRLSVDPHIEKQINSVTGDVRYVFVIFGITQHVFATLVEARTAMNAWHAAHAWGKGERDTRFQ